MKIYLETILILLVLKYVTNCTELNKSDKIFKKLLKNFKKFIVKF